MTDCKTPCYCWKVYHWGRVSCKPKSSKSTSCHGEMVQTWWWHASPSKKSYFLDRCLETCNCGDLVAALLPEMPQLTPLHHELPFMSLDNDDQSVEEVLEELAFWKKKKLVIIDLKKGNDFESVSKWYKMQCYYLTFFYHYTRHLPMAAASNFKIWKATSTQ